MTSSHFTVEHDILKFVTQRYLWNLGRVEVELKFLLSDIERPVLIAVRVYLLHKNIGSCTLQNVKMILDRQFWRISLFPCNLNTLSWFLNTSKISALIELKFWHGYYPLRNYFCITRFSYIANFFWGKLLQLLYIRCKQFIMSCVPIPFIDYYVSFY